MTVRKISVPDVACHFVSKVTDQERDYLWSEDGILLDDWDWILFDSDDAPGSAYQILEFIQPYNLRVETFYEVNFRGKSRTLHIQFHA